MRRNALFNAFRVSKRSQEPVARRKPRHPLRAIRADYLALALASGTGKTEDCLHAAGCAYSFGVDSLRAAEITQQREGSLPGRKQHLQPGHQGHGRIGRSHPRPACSEDVQMIRKCLLVSYHTETQRSCQDRDLGAHGLTDWLRTSGTENRGMR